MDILLIILITIILSICIFLLSYYTSGIKAINNLEIEREKLLLKEYLKGRKKLPKVDPNLIQYKKW